MQQDRCSQGRRESECYRPLSSEPTVPPKIEQLHDVPVSVGRHPKQPQRKGPFSGRVTTQSATQAIAHRPGLLPPLRD
jgi:hypothetical protein